MLTRALRSLPGVVFLMGSLVVAPCARTQLQRPNNGIPTFTPNDSTGATTVSLIVLVRDASGGPVDMALATLGSTQGGMLNQATTVGGRVEFSNMAPGDYTLEVSAAGYETVRERLNVNGQASFANILLKPSGSSDGASHSNVPPMPVLAPKAQKLLTKALESLRAKKTEEAHADLEQALRLAPGHPEVHYLYGVYSMQASDLPGAMAHWEKALSLYPKHFGSLMYMGEGLMREKKPGEAIAYLDRAIEVAPSDWHPHAQMAQADAMLGPDHYDDAVHEAERAMELGHSQAAGVEPLLANVLAAQGKKERAISVWQQYLKERPDDTAARKRLDSLRAGQAAAPATTPAAPAVKKDPEPPRL